MIIDLGERFRLVRNKAGFTQTQVARYLEVDQSYISKFERGDRQLGMQQLNVMRGKLVVSVQKS